MAVKRKPAPKRNRCLTCSSRRQSRGLCWSCLREAHAAIRSGESTEQGLIDAGLILPKQKSGRSVAASPWRRKLAKVSK